MYLSLSKHTVRNAHYKRLKIIDGYFLFDLGHSRCSTKQGQQRETGGCNPAEPEGLVLYEAQAAEM